MCGVCGSFMGDLMRVTAQTSLSPTLPTPLSRKAKLNYQRRMWRCMQRKCVFAHMPVSILQPPPPLVAATAPLDAAKHASAILKHISLDCTAFASPSKNVLAGRREM